MNLTASSTGLIVRMAAWAAGVSLAVLVAVLSAAAQDAPPLPSPTPIPIERTPPADLPNEPPPVAPDFKAPPRPLPTTNRVGVDVGNQVPLTLENAIRLALENNNAIAISRNDVEIAEFNLKRTEGVYDPEIFSEGSYERATTPVASLIGGAVNGSVTNTRYFGSGGVQGFTRRFGGSYVARFDSTRSTTSNTNAFLNPNYPALLTFQYTQPLLRNRSTDNNRRQIEIAKKNLSLSDSQFRAQAIEVISRLEQAYWNLAFALRNLQVQIDAVKQARSQLESNERLVSRGVLAPIEVVAATAQVTSLEQNVFAAQEEVTRNENILKTLIAPDRNSSVWSQALTPVSPVSFEAPRIGLDVAIAEALKNRPEIAQLETSAEINRIDRAFFENQTKPQIDLVGSYSSQGLAGAETARAIDPTTGLSRVPANLVGNYLTSLGNLLAQDYPTFRVGVTITLPWGNTAAKADLGRTLVEERRIGNVRALTEQAIEAEVRNALQALRSAEARLASASVNRSAAEQLYESEQRQFQSGTTTFYRVLERQNELIASQGRELQAQTDLNRAISEFQRATGTTLSANNVSVTDGRNLLLRSRDREFTFNARPLLPITSTTKE